MWRGDEQINNNKDRYYTEVSPKIEIDILKIRSAYILWAKMKHVCYCFPLWTLCELNELTEVHFRALLVNYKTINCLYKSMQHTINLKPSTHCMPLLASFIRALNSTELVCFPLCSISSIIKWDHFIGTTRLCYYDQQ